MSRLYPLMQQVIEAWQAKDVEQVLSRLDEEIVWHYAAGAAPPVRGKAAAGRLLRRFQSDMHEIRWRIFAHAEDGDRLFIEGVDEYRTSEGLRIAAPYAGVLEFRGDLILGWRDYVDVGLLDRQRRGEPISPYVEELLTRPGL